MMGKLTAVQGAPKTVSYSKKESENHEKQCIALEPRGDTGVNLSSTTTLAYSLRAAQKQFTWRKRKAPLVWGVNCDTHRDTQ